MSSAMLSILKHYVQGTSERIKPRKKEKQRKREKIQTHERKDQLVPQCEATMNLRWDKRVK
jgi:hypothetical protein